MRGLSIWYGCRWDAIFGGMSQTPTQKKLSSITPAALDETDASAYLGITISFLRAARLGRCDGPAFVRYGRAVRYPVEDLDNFIDARRVVRASHGRASA